MSGSEVDDLVLALGPVVQTLRSLSVPFYVGGSVASSYHGAVRSTMDVDLVCEMTDDQVAGLLNQLGEDYYASEPAIREAIRRKSSFNLIHYSTSFKVDVFVSPERPFDRQVIARAQSGTLGRDAALTVPFATAGLAVRITIVCEPNHIQKVSPHKVIHNGTLAAATEKNGELLRNTHFRSMQMYARTLRNTTTS